MSYVIRRNDNALLAKPEAVGAAVRWVQWDSGVAPWTFVTRSGADKALAMHAHGKATVEPLEEVTLGGATLSMNNLTLWQECPKAIGFSG
jgi:hypothetical protein